MFALCRVTTLDVAQRGVSLDDTRTDQVVQAQEVLVMAQSIEVPPAERQSTEILRNGVK